MASSEMEAMMGMVMIATPRPAAIRVCWGVASQIRWMTSGATTVRAKNPITTLGTPASTSTRGFSTRRTRGEAYSLR